MNEELKNQHCVPCEGGIDPIGKEDAEKTMMPQVPGWELSADGKSIFRNFEFKDFKESLAFVNKVAEIAESEGHHPDMSVWYNKVKLELSTHAIGGLSTNDFVLAAKVNALK